MGIVDKKKIIDGSRLTAGDVLVGLPSSGIHSNGYSLVRKLFKPTPEKLGVEIDALGMTLGDALIEPTKIYVKAIDALISACDVKAISHITGGGFIENIPRMLKDGTVANIDLGTWPVLPIFNLMQELGGMSHEEMYNTFNMGIGMIVAINKDDGDKALEALEAIGEKAYIIGSITKGEKGLNLCQK